MEITLKHMRYDIYECDIYIYINFKIAQRPTFPLDELNV